MFNEEMTSKMQPATGSGTVTEYTWEQGSVVLLVKKKKKKMADISLVSRVRTTAGTRRYNG